MSQGVPPEAADRSAASAPAQVRCDQCGAEVPALEVCIRCGDPLVEELRRGRQGRLREGYAAAPDERPSSVNLVSTLFPALPKDDMRAFRMALLAGFDLVVGLGLLGYFPVAVLVAAVVVPLITIIYLYDVDVYEDEPIRVIAFTFLWGAVTGALFAWGLDRLFPVTVADLGSALAATDSGIHIPVDRAIVAPIVAGLLMLLGPALLLRAKRFNDALDGATFGVASAVAFVGAQTIVTSSSLFESGLRPVGEPLPWVLLLLTIGLAMPLIAAGAIGGATAALWLRYRTPVADRGLLGPVGHPGIAIVLALVLLVAAAIARSILSDVAALIVLAILAVVAMLWLRRAIHVGLIQESREIPVGAPIGCANCGRMTPTHSFCGHCGIALRALPKERPSAGQTAAEPAGTTHPGASRLGRRGVLLLFAVGLLVVGGVGVAIGYVAGQDQDRPECPDPTLPCPAARQPLADRTARLVDSLGYGFEYDPDQWEVLKADDGFDVLASRYSGTLVRLTVLPAREWDVKRALEMERSFAADRISALAVDDVPARTILGNPSLGQRPGAAGVYGGVMDNNGSTFNVGVAIVAATDGVATAVAAIWADETVRDGALDEADSLLNSLVWPTDLVGRGALAAAEARAGTAADASDLPKRGLTPQDLATAYGHQAVWDQGITGAGTEIAILQYGTETDDDLAVFDRQFGLSGPAPERIAVGDGLADREDFKAIYGDQGDENFVGFAGEAALDTQVVRAVAPGATILVYGTPIGGWVEGLDRIVRDGRARIVSISYGGCAEKMADPGFAEYAASIEAAFANAAANGVSVLVASGDNGAYPCRRFDRNDLRASSGWPDCTPGAISVGGTDLEVREDGTYLRETGWQEYLSGGGTGGGINRQQPRPAFQTGAPGVDNELSNGHRQCPDVSAAASPDSGYVIRGTDPITGFATWQTVGGTSGAAPFWAGVLALVQQAAAQEGLTFPANENLAGLLYRIGAKHPEAFHDITRGGNLLHASGGGWDYATGLGSPDVPALVAAAIEELRAGGGAPPAS